MMIEMFYKTAKKYRLVIKTHSSVPENNFIRLISVENDSMVVRRSLANKLKDTLCELIKRDAAAMNVFVWRKINKEENWLV